jgi:hypothetical protein
MRALLAGVLMATVAVGAGCTSHVLFTEHSHLGLKASFEPNQPTPAEVDLGWRRALFAMVPQKSRQGSAPGSGYVKVTQPQKSGDPLVVEVKPDPNELMSLYTVFRANVGFGDPICIHHFLATGVAASSLLANETDLRELARSLKVNDATNVCGPRATTQAEDDSDEGANQ